MRTQTIPKILPLIFTLVFCFACRRQAAPPPEILVAAAANVSEAFNEIGAAFEAHQQTRVKFSFGATGALAKQIENGAPFDLFVAADVVTVERLIQTGHLRGETKRVYARGRLVLWTRDGSGVQLATLDDVTKPEVKRIAVANPELAPYGRAAIDSLTASGLLERVKGKLVYSESVSQAWQFAESGNAEVAFIPRSLTSRRAGRFIEVDERLHAPLDQALAVVSASKRAAAARSFADFVTNEAGRGVLARFGYR
jgi:molybdate transport system substrate-binding protein